MNLLLQNLSRYVVILLLLLTWLTAFANTTPPAQKLAIPNYSIPFSKVEKQKLASAVKIGVQNFARNEITNEPQTTYLLIGSFFNTFFSNIEKEDFSSSSFEKDLSKSQYCAFNFSKKKQLSILEKRARKDVGMVVSGAGNWVTIRTTWLNSLKSQYGTFDISNFKPQRLNAANVPSTTYSEMLGEYSNAIDNVTKQGYLNGLIKSGSTIPVKNTFDVGDELYKIVPKGEGVTPFTPFFMTKAEFEALETAANIEQKLGLPLISHSVEYDVYKITATQEAKAFENTIANTLEKTYTTTGGGKQMLVIDRSKWSAPVKVKTIIPNQ